MRKKSITTEKIVFSCTPKKELWLRTVHVRCGNQLYWDVWETLEDCVWKNLRNSVGYFLWDLFEIFHSARLRLLSWGSGFFFSSKHFCKGKHVCNKKNNAENQREIHRWHFKWENKPQIVNGKRQINTRYVKNT